MEAVTGQPLPPSTSVVMDNTSSSYPSPSAQSHRKRLNEIMSQYFPQYGPLCYLPIEMASLNDAIPEPSFRCSLNLFGTTLETAESFESWERAQEETAGLGLSMVEEFLRLLLARRNDPLFGQVLAPVIRSLEAFRTPSSVFAAQDGSETHHSAKVLTMGDDREVVEARQEFFGPLVGSILDKLAHPESIPRTFQEATSTTVASAMDSSVHASLPKPKQPGTASNPISFLHQHWQRHSASLARPEIESFVRTHHFGAIGRYAGQEVMVQALYARKNDARQEAARLLCLRIMGDGVPFQEIPPDLPAKEGDNNQITDVVVATSKSAMAAAQQQQQQQSKPELEIARTRAASAMDGDDFMRELPSGPLKQHSLNGKSFVTILNEFCQKTRLSSPDFVFYNVNQSLTQAYCCRVASFSALSNVTATGPSSPSLLPARSFMGYAFMRKKDAKEDCAGRIVQYLIEEDAMDSQGQPTRLSPTERTVQRGTSAAPVINFPSPCLELASSYPLPLPPPPPFLLGDAVGTRIFSPPFPPTLTAMERLPMPPTLAGSSQRRNYVQRLVSQPTASPSPSPPEAASVPQKVAAPSSIPEGRPPCKR